MKKLRTWMGAAGTAAALTALAGLPVFASDGEITTADTFMLLVRVVVIAVGVIAAALLVLLIRKFMSKAAAKKAKVYYVVKAVIAVVCIVVLVVGNWAVSAYSANIDAVFTKTEGTEADTDEEDWLQLVTDIADEGMTLLQNNGDVLPLAEGTKVNLLGYYSYNPIYSGSGSGSVSASDAISIQASLEDAGFEINPAVLDAGIYTVEETSDNSIGFSTTSFTVDEASIDSYTGDASFESMAEYSEVAIITLGRSGGEGADLTSYEGDDYLDLQENEADLLEAACETFDTVILLLNTDNAMNMEFLNDYDIDAILWVGIPGPYGFESLGRILNGTVNPSGKLSDTWVYDNDSAPANENFGEQEASNAEGRYYVDYVEGIYVGYKWYETAYAEGAVITNTTTGETFDYANDYDSIVTWPFGYGLSYTEFSQEITSVSTDTLDPTGEFTVEVTVTNTGDVAGKSTVQLYVTVPYTDYDIANGVEKAEVALVTYDKTETLEPGESEVITLTVTAEDIASYDSSYDNGDGTSGAYMLDEGEYIFSIRSDAHTAIEETTLTLDETYFYSGENQRASDDQAAYNQFEDAARGIYLSRNNAFGNYEEAMNSVVDEIENLDWVENDNYYDTAEYDDIITKEYVEGVDYASGGDLTIEDVEGLDYDDPLWDELIAQLTIDELVSLATDNMYATPGVDSIDMGNMTNIDGPLGLSSMMNSELSSISYPSLPLLAATFNTDLAYQFGLYVADAAHTKGVTGWYAPAMNIHRSAYAGRNFEYYSEDSVLSGMMAAAEVSGAVEGGLVVYIKHFALNEQETNRDSVHTYSNEQAIREIYLKSFEYAVKDGGANGVMTSMNYIGDVYAGANEALITEVLRNEWGFKGVTLTDMDQGGENRSSDAALRAGQDGWLPMAGTYSTDSDADIYYLQRAAKHTLYAYANAVRVTSTVLNWELYLYILYAELIIIALISVAGIVVDVLNAKKKAAVKVE